MSRISFELAGATVEPEENTIVYVPLPRLKSHSELYMPVHVVHGKEDGPVLLVSAAIHGDELNGIEIIRRLVSSKMVSKLRGTLLAVPMVNAYGLMNESRYLPDRRDLNRAFPGSETGSLASRLAHLFMQEVVSRCTYGIDLHTGSNHRTNLPQVRANLDDPETERLARSFGVPVLLNSALRDGSLRAAAGDLGIPILLYEAGEALRYNSVAIRAGTKGIFNVMRALEMLTPQKNTGKNQKPYIARSSRWVRAPESGMLRTTRALGTQVSKGDVLGYIDDSGRLERVKIVAAFEGVIIGRLELPIVHEGDAVFHIARFKDDSNNVADLVETFHLDHGD
jgi:predicted deacylase